MRRGQDSLRGRALRSLRPGQVRARVDRFRQGRGSRDTAPLSARALARRPISVSSAAARTSVSAVPGVAGAGMGSMVGGGAGGAGRRERMFAGGFFAAGPVGEGIAFGVPAVCLSAAGFRVPAAGVLTAVGFLAGVLVAARFLGAVGFLAGAGVLAAGDSLAAARVVVLPAAGFPAAGVVAAAGGVAATGCLAAAGVPAAGFPAAAAVRVAAGFLAAARADVVPTLDFGVPSAAGAGSPPAGPESTGAAARRPLRRWGRVEGREPITPRRSSLIAQ